MSKQIIKVIIPAYNEQDAIAKVISDLPKIVDEVIVISNNSTDHTELNAKNAGATVLKEHRQ
jgi:glycosyltransferase involved in cell wall biosynthesis